MSWRKTWLDICKVEVHSKIARFPKVTIEVQPYFIGIIVRLIMLLNLSDYNTLQCHSLKNGFMNTQLNAYPIHRIKSIVFICISQSLFYTDTSKTNHMAILWGRNMRSQKHIDADKLVLKFVFVVCCKMYANISI